MFSVISNVSEYPNYLKKAIEKVALLFEETTEIIKLRN